MGENTVLRVAHMEEDTALLGPFRRFVVWVHGCCFDCEGCLAENTKTGPYTEVDVSALAERIAACGCEGITLSGGEPFLQAEALAALARSVRAKRDVGIIAYSGFTLDELRADPAKAPLLGELDVLIDGRYVRELDDGRAYVGSSNQTIHYLTPRYVEAGRDYYAAASRRAEIRLTPTQAVLIGVPSKQALRVWQDMKAKSGGMRNDF